MWGILEEVPGLGARESRGLFREEMSELRTKGPIGISQDTYPPGEGSPEKMSDLVWAIA